MFYAKSTGGFYDAAIHGNNIPSDSVEITTDEHAALMQAQASGYIIDADEQGMPVAGIPQKLLGQVITDKLTEIESARDTACVANVTALGRTWQADKRSQDLLGQAITLAQAGLPLPPVWRDYDNNDMPVNSVADLLAIAGAMAQATQAAYLKSWALKAQVEQAQTVAEVEAVVW